jgi:hypothetical protein
VRAWNTLAHPAIFSHPSSQGALTGFVRLWPTGKSSSPVCHYWVATRQGVILHWLSYSEEQWVVGWRGPSRRSLVNFLPSLGKCPGSPWCFTLRCLGLRLSSGASSPKHLRAAGYKLILVTRFSGLSNALQALAARLFSGLWHSRLQANSWLAFHTGPRMSPLWLYLPHHVSDASCCLPPHIPWIPSNLSDLTHLTSP